MLSGVTLRTLGESSRFGLRFVAFALLAALSPPEVRAHDPDVYGGLFRTHDAGAHWTPVNPGIYASGALAVAVSPRDPNHVLLATESGVWRSRNGGRDWEVEAPEMLAGTALAVAFDADGERALVAGVATLFRYDGGRWRSISLPSGAAPARSLVAASLAGRVYLAGRSGLYRSDDCGRTWTRAGASLKAEHVEQVLVTSRPDEVYAVAAGTVWSSDDAGRGWRPWGGTARAIDAIGLDPVNPAGLWAVADGQILRSSRPGEQWRTVGSEVPERPAKARALAILGEVVVIATDRGVFRSSHAGAQWEPPREGLPAHLPAGVLVSDPRRPATFYAGFALTSYEELRQRAAKAGVSAASSAPGYGSTLLVFIGLGALGLIAGALSLARARGGGRPSTGRVPQ
jgi:photosystem II stability/assembly factor-like uncharacterized protein